MLHDIGKMRARTFLPFIIVISLLLNPSTPGHAAAAGRPLQLVKGVLDISNVEFRRSDIFVVIGSAEFYWKKLIEKPSIQSDGFIKLSDSWVSQKINGSLKIENGFGFGTYKITLKSAKGREYMVKLYSQEVEQAWRLYQYKPLTGEIILLGEGGQVAADRDGFIGSKIPLSATFAHTELSELYIQLSAFQNYNIAGICSSLFIGHPAAIDRLMAEKRQMDFFIVGIMFIIGLYNFLLFLMRRNEKAPLVFALFCFLMAIRALFSGRYVSESITGSLIAGLSTKIEYMSFFFGPTLVLSFKKLIFPSIYRREVVILSLIISSVYSLFVLFVPTWAFTGFLSGYHVLLFYIFALCVICYIVFGVIRAFFAYKDILSGLAFFGIVILAVTAINDILFANQMLNTFGWIAHYGLMVYIFSQATIFAISNSEARHTAEYLSINLQQEVAKQTEEIHGQNKKLNESNAALFYAKNALWGEMQLAKKIQTVLLPEKPTMPNYDISVHMTPCHDVGGDYYDVIEAGGYYWLVIGDVSGHGVPAGLIMMMVQTSIHSILNQNPTLSPSTLLSLLNTTIRKNVMRLGEDKYITITVFAAHSNGKFIYSGLHQDILIHRAESDSIDCIVTQGVWLGLYDEISGMIVDDSLQLANGDTMLLYTDGITEAWKKGSVKNMRSPEEMFGPARLLAVFSRCANTSPGEIKNLVLDELKSYDCADDVTLVVVKKIG